MKSQLRTVDQAGVHYTALLFMCPGCAEQDGNEGIHMLPVNTVDKSPSWTFTGSVDAPTISPSILTRGAGDTVCHSFLRDGVFEFLGDCTHSLAGQHVPMPDLPAWIVREFPTR